MPTTGNPKLDVLLYIGLALYAVYTLQTTWGRWQSGDPHEDMRHRNAVRESIKSGRHRDYAVNDVLTVLWEMLRYRVQDIAEATNAEAKRRPDVAVPIVEPAYRTTDEAIGRIYDVMDRQTDEQLIATTAFVLGVLGRQLHDLARGEGYVSVGTLCYEMTDRAKAVSSGTRRFAFDQDADAIGLLCGVFNDITERTTRLRKNGCGPSTAAGTPTGRRRRGRPPKRTEG